MTGLDRWIALLIFLAVSAVTLAASSRQGIHRDEAYYMDAGEQYVTYVELSGTREINPVSDAAIRRFWDYNHEHPPFAKLLYGISWRLLHRCDCTDEAPLHPGPARILGEPHPTLGVLFETAAFRLPTILFFGLLAALVYLFVVDAFGRRTAALAAALLTACQPRAFFHAQTASFDMVAAALWFACVYCYWRSLKSRWSGAIVLGLLYGFFLATKLQSFFLPATLLIHWVWFGIRRLRVRESWPNVRPFIAMATLGPALFFGLWPWLWHDTLSRLGRYLAFHWQHVHYNFEYFGVNYNRPPYPWHEPLGMLVTTAPVITLVLALGGLAALRRTPPEDRSTRALLLCAALVPVAPFFTGRPPIFGETKHWLATMPYIAILAGLGIDAIARALADEVPRLRRLWPATLVIIAATPAASETARSHPYGLSHYNALAGGAPGGADLGMNRQFWGYSVAGLLEWFNQNLPANARLYLHDWNHDSWEMYQREERLRPDIIDAGMEDPGIRQSDAAIVIHEKHFNKYEYMIWNAYGHLRPTRVLTFDGVPLVTVYLR